MDKDLEFYLNNLRTNCCMPNRLDECLSKKNYLSEFATNDEKEVARLNLGITEKLNEVISLINTKVIEAGGVPVDLIPIESNTDHVVSSAGLYNTFLNYVLKSEIQTWKELLWLWFLEKADTLTSQLDASLEDIRENNNALCIRLNNMSKELEAWKSDFDERFMGNVYSLQLSLKCVVKDEMKPFVDEYFKLKEELDDLKKTFAAYIQTSSSGLAISDKFGNNDYLSVSLKTLTEAINNIYAKIADIVGEPNNRVLITITPDYVVTDQDCEVTITAKASTDGFEAIKVYAGEEVIYDSEEHQDETTFNPMLFLHTMTIRETTKIKVEAVILGKLYVEEKTVTVLYPFFIGCAYLWTEIMNEDYAVPYNGNVEGRYDITVHQDGERIFVVLPKSMVGDVGRIHMNGYDIPFSVREEDKYMVYTSTNTYISGTYTIYIENLI